MTKKSTAIRLFIVNILSFAVVSTAFVVIIFMMDSTLSIIQKDVMKNLEFITRNSEIRSRLFDLYTDHSNYKAFLKKTSLLNQKSEKIHSVINHINYLVDKGNNIFDEQENRKILDRYLTLLLQHFGDYLILDSILTKIENSTSDFYSHIKLMEEAAGSLIIDLTIESKDATAIQQIYALIPFCREQVLRAQHILESSIRGNDPHLLGVDISHQPGDQTVSSFLLVLEQTLDTLTSADKRIAIQARKILQKIELHKALLSNLHSNFNRLLNNHAEIEKAGSLINITFKEVNSETNRTVQGIGKNIEDQLRKTSLTSYAAFAVMLIASILASFFIYLINRQVEKSSREILQSKKSLEKTNEKLKLEIDERIQAENTLRKFKHIVSASNELMCFIDSDYNYREVNDAYIRAHNKTREKIVGSSVAEILGEQTFLKITKDNLDNCLAGSHIHFESWYNFPGTGRRYMDESYYPFYSADGNISGVVANSRDITKRKLAEEELRHAQKMESIGTMAGGIAHDFNNILTGIMGYTELTLQTIDHDSDTFKNLHKIKTGCKRAADLVSQILTFSRQQVLEKKPLWPQLVIKEAMKFLRATLPTNIEFRLEIDEHCRQILADVTQIYQVVMNLGTNAFHAMRDNGGILTVTLKEITVNPGSKNSLHAIKSGVYAHLTISDTGHGIANETLKKIFEPYFTTKDIGEGTGLGLATVHGIVKNHDGEIIVSSIISQGTTFDIYFPIAPQESLDDEEDKEIYREQFSCKILFIDDEEMIAGAAKQNLQQAGCEVEVFTDSKEALKRFKTTPEQFDIVITDYIMPKLNGLDLAKSLLKIRSDIPIIMFTGYMENLDQKQIKLSGIKEVLLKPLDMQTMLKSVHELLE